ncbi:hypothetical protein Csa_011490, partial [Cucumis sativus]
DGLPKKVDWVESAVVTPPRDQGPSPTCWAYSGVAAIESMNKIKRGQLVNLTVVDVIIDNIRFWMDGAWPDVGIVKTTCCSKTHGDVSGEKMDIAESPLN